MAMIISVRDSIYFSSALMVPHRKRVVASAQCVCVRVCVIWYARKKYSTCVRDNGNNVRWQDWAWIWARDWFDWFSVRGLLGVKNETTPARNFKISKWVCAAEELVTNRRNQQTEPKESRRAATATEPINIYKLWPCHINTGSLVACTPFAGLRTMKSN